MKKIMVLCLIIFVSSLSISGCGNSEAKEQAFDVDLTLLSSTMVYGEVFNIVTNPEDYLGKTIRVRGMYYAFYYEITDSFYHYIYIEDAAACCQQGLEFILSDDYIFPEDYPPDYTFIELEGIYSKYEEIGHTYYYIAADTIRYNVN